MKIKVSVNDLTPEEQRAVDEAVDRAGTIDVTLIVLIAFAIAGVVIGLTLRGGQ